MIPRGVILMTEQFPGAALQDVVQTIEALGYDSIWLPELFGREPFATAGYLLAGTQRIAIATGIADVYARDACATAQARHCLAELSGGRFMLGLGVSNAGANGRRGHAWMPPLTKLTTYLEAMAAVEVGAPPPAQPAPLHLAAHGPKLQALSVRHGAGVITYLMPPAHTRISRARIDAATALSVVAPFIAEQDPTIARAKARAALAVYMSLDYYHREWRKLGFGDADFDGGGSDRLIDTLVAWGDMAALHEHVAEYERAGATRVIVLPLALKTRAGLDMRVLEQLAPAAARGMPAAAPWV